MPVSLTVTVPLAQRLGPLEPKGGTRAQNVRFGSISDLP